MPMYNLLEYNDNYSMTSGSLLNYYGDETNDDESENNDNGKKVNNNKKITSKCFEYKAKLTGSMPNNNNILEAEVVVPLKDLSNFWRSLDLSLSNCEIELDLSCLKECIISEISVIPRIPGNPDTNPPVQEVAAIHKTSATFQINNAKLYVPFVTLPINDVIKFLEYIRI